MSTDQLMNAHRTFLEEEGNDLRLNDLIERINVPHEEVRLFPQDKLKLTCCLKVMASFLQTISESARNSPLT